MDPKSDALLAEAAQFALLRRLAPSLRHRLIGGLHPVGLLAELASRRLATDSQDLTSARDAVARIQLQARLATETSIAVLAWITGEESPSVLLKEGVEACVALLRTDSEMRGTEISSRLGELDVAVSRRALRTVFTASLVAAVDMVPHPARIELYTRSEGDGVGLRIEVHSLQPSQSQSFAGDERPLTWDDVEALAKIEGVEVLRTISPTVFHCRFGPFGGRPGREGSTEVR